MEDYTKYRWFFTSSNKLVVGGKSDEQNESLVKEILNEGKDYIVMHTSEPGSPFSFILEEPEKVKEKDIQEAAIFTACFSKQWGKEKKRVEIDVFQTPSISKKKTMKKGTFGVSMTIEKIMVPLKLYLTIQKGKPRAVPNPDLKLIEITPGSLDKEQAGEKIKKILKEKNLLFTTQEVLSAIPSKNINLKIMGKLK